MSSETSIEWTDHTFSPWWGCTKVHAGCKNCYAETMDARWAGKGKEHWGPSAARRMIVGEWGKPGEWNRAAKRKLGRRARVFCASMCDIFEDFNGVVENQLGQRLYRDGEDRVRTQETPLPVTVVWLRWRVWELIMKTPNLYWLLLTKRPENIERMVPPAWLVKWPDNVMTGTSPCDQETADVCVPALLRTPGPHFLSCEPLIGPIDFAKIPDEWDRPPGHGSPTLLGDIEWVIFGGESGGGARPCNIEWIRSGVAQCRAAGIAPLVKQLGANVHWNGIGTPEEPVFPGAARREDVGGAFRVYLKDSKGGDMQEWPEDLRVRQWPKEAS